jgi:hypothetical protein
MRRAHQDKSAKKIAELSEQLKALKFQLNGSSGGSGAAEAKSST